ncbi:MFS transporter [Sodalis ligni]|uniref:MFS transporter n=1 Tax=unclassified Sodalis (in: enterobacteria) TaxID=2636512 RepID=UPI00193F8394
MLNDPHVIPNKRWVRILPPILLVYIVALMDRVNIGFAIAGGMDKDLGLSTTFAGLVAGIFFIGYLLLQIPGGLIAAGGSAKKFIAYTIVGWGATSILMGFVEKDWQVLTLRFILGVAEGGVFPALLIIISNWFPNAERARANAIFIGGIVFIANFINGPIAGWIISRWSWRELFIIEGVMSLLLLFIWFPIISNRPDDADWISEEERSYINNKIREEQEASIHTGSLMEILKQNSLWKLVVIYFCYQTGIYGFSFWLPTMIKNLTTMGIGAVGFLSTLPYVAMLIGTYAISSLSDKRNNRKFFIALSLFGFALFLICSAQFSHYIWVSFTFLVLCGLFYESASSVFWTIPPVLFPHHLAGGARGVINALGNLGGFVGPFMIGWMTSQYSLSTGIYCLAGILLVGFLTTLTLPGHLTHPKSPEAAAGLPKATNTSRETGA